MNNVIEKSLEKSIVFETWLYLSIHYVNGWRQNNICDTWPYLDDERVIKKYGNNIEKLKEDILQEKIDD